MPPRPVRWVGSGPFYRHPTLAQTDPSRAGEWPPRGDPALLDCRTERGREVCSCGLYRLIWSWDAVTEPPPHELIRALRFEDDDREIDGDAVIAFARRRTPHLEPALGGLWRVVAGHFDTRAADACRRIGGGCVWEGC